MTIPARRWPTLRRIARARRLGAKALGLVIRMALLYFATLGVAVQLSGLAPEAQRLALAFTLAGCVVALISALLARP